MSKRMRTRKQISERSQNARTAVFIALHADNAVGRAVENLEKATRKLHANVAGKALMSQTAWANAAEACKLASVNVADLVSKYSCAVGAVGQQKTAEEAAV